MALGIGLYLIPLGMVAAPTLIELKTAPVDALTNAGRIAIALAAMSYGIIAPLNGLLRLGLIAGGAALLFAPVLILSLNLAGRKASGRALPSADAREQLSGDGRLGEPIMPVPAGIENARAVLGWPDHRQRIRCRGRHPSSADLLGAQARRIAFRNAQHVFGRAWFAGRSAPPSSTCPPILSLVSSGVRTKPMSENVIGWRMYAGSVSVAL
jgi:hypothetical protein